MGFYVRKSVKAGPFRFNLSKSGIGFSAGVPGFRVSTGPRGNHVSIGSHGVYYRTTLGGGRRRTSAARGTRRAVSGPARSPRAVRVQPVDEVVLHDTQGAGADQLVPSGGGDLVAQLNTAAARSFPWTLLLVAVLFVAAAAGRVGVVIAVLGIPAVVWLALRARARRKVVALYEVDGPPAQWFQQVVDAFDTMAGAAKAWRLTGAGEVVGTRAYKTHAGVALEVTQAAATITTAAPGHQRRGPDRHRRTGLPALPARPGPAPDRASVHRRRLRPAQRPARVGGLHRVRRCATRRAAGGHPVAVHEPQGRTGPPVQEQSAAARAPLRTAHPRLLRRPELGDRPVPGSTRPGGADRLAAGTGCDPRPDRTAHRVGAGTLVRGVLRPPGPWGG